MKKTLATLLSFVSVSSAVPPNLSQVPEPTTYLMMAAGLGVLFYSRHRFTKKK